jgi:tryptophan-rich sensory protein
VWIPLKLAQSVALALVWRAGSGVPAMHSKLGLALGVYGLHMALGNWWNVVFFGRRQISGSIKWMMAFWASTAGVRPCVCIRDGVVIANSQTWGRKHTSCLMLLVGFRPVRV